jgi:predicted aspartyl protease
MMRSFARVSLHLWAAAALTAGVDVSAPFDFIHNQILLRVTINGSGPYDMVLDTGTFSSTVDLKVARRLNLPLGAAAPVTGGAGVGRPYGHRTVCAEVKVGDVTSRNLDAVVLDLSKVAKQLGRPLHGVLGYGFLSSWIVQIDYVQRRVRLRSSLPSEGGIEHSRRVTLPMRFRPQSVLPVIDECYVNGRRIALSLDTGSSLGLILFPRTIDRLGLRALARSGVRMQATGYLGEAYLTKGWVRSLAIKTLDLGAIEAGYVERGYADQEDPDERGGSLGNGVLQDFLVILDYPNRVVMLEPVE